MRRSAPVGMTGIARGGSGKPNCSGGSDAGLLGRWVLFASPASVGMTDIARGAGFVRVAATRACLVEGVYSPAAAPLDSPLGLLVVFPVDPVVFR